MRTSFNQKTSSKHGQGVNVPAPCCGPAPVPRAPTSPSLTMLQIFKKKHQKHNPLSVDALPASEEAGVALEGKELSAWGRLSQLGNQAASAAKALVNPLYFECSCNGAASSRDQPGASLAGGMPTLHIKWGNAMSAEGAQVLSLFYFVCLAGVP